MDIQRVYLKFTDRVNALSSNHSQSVGGLRQFVDSFNEAQYSLMVEILAADEASDAMIEYLSPLVETVKLSGSLKNGYEEYPLPTNYEHFKRVDATYKAGDCTGKLEVNLRRLSEVSSLLSSSMYSPSYEWEETFCVLAGKKLRLYVDKFRTTSYLEYYRQPTEVNIEGYSIQGITSTNVNPDFEGRFLELVLDRAARLYLRNVSDPKASSY